MYKFLSCILLSFFIQNCSGIDSTNEENYLPQGTLMRVNSYTVSCEGFIPMQCLLVQQDEQIGTEQWSYLFQDIEGLDYEAGYLYDLDVRITTVENPPADSSSLRYELIKLIKKYKP